MDYAKISITIPLYFDGPNFRRCLQECLRLDYPNYEILLVIDWTSRATFDDPRVKMIHTGKERTGPAEKRDLAIAASSGEYVAFLDDDAYPAQDWLRTVADHFRNSGAAAVCGPGLTPPESNFAQRVSGAILCSVFGSGPHIRRFRAEPPTYVNDYPAYNLTVRKSMLEKVGGFNTTFYGGEDTALCLKIVNAGGKVLYVPDCVVYHFRRPFPGRFLRQISNYGVHRGYFAKKYPQTSRRPVYFLPTASLLLGSLWVTAASFHAQAALLLALAIVLFLAVVIVDSLRRDPLAVALLLPLCIPLVHVAYGVSLIRGLLTRHLEV